MKYLMLIVIVSLMFFTACDSKLVVPLVKEEHMEGVTQSSEPQALDTTQQQQSTQQPTLTLAPDLTPAPTLTIISIPTQNPVPEPTITNMPAPSMGPIGEDDAEKFLGSYIGYYNNNSGKMNLIIDVYMLDMTKNTSNIWAHFTFSPGVGNTTGKSGEYKVEGDLNLFTGQVTMHGTQWISPNPENYNMLGFSGIITETTFNGLLDRPYLPEFYLSKWG